MMISVVRSNDKDDGEDDENDGADISIVMKCTFVCVTKNEHFPLHEMSAGGAKRNSW